MQAVGPRLLCREPRGLASLCALHEFEQRVGYGPVGGENIPSGGEDHDGDVEVRKVLLEVQFLIRGYENIESIGYR